MAGQTEWMFEAEYIQSCNCDYGCSCNFNGLPTGGSCEALDAWRITKGNFGKTKLDGVTFAIAFWWPRAIHLGNGTARVYVDPKASKEQADAITAITTSGKHGGAFFELVPKVCTKIHPTRMAKIDFRYNGYDSSFTVEGVGEVRSEHIKNPVTGTNFEGSLDLPGGIIFKKAIITSISSWWMKDEDLLARHQNKNGHVAKVKFSNAGCIA
jgi:hypothetical protein